MPVGFQRIEVDRPFPGQRFALAELGREGIGVFTPAPGAEIAQRDLNRHHIDRHRFAFRIVPVLDDPLPDAQKTDLDRRHRGVLRLGIGWWGKIGR